MINFRSIQDKKSKNKAIFVHLIEKRHYGKKRI
jgi:hypothetical protein